MTVRVLVKPFRMLLELVVLLVCSTWALLFLLKSLTLSSLCFVVRSVLGLVRFVVCLVLGLVRLVVWFTLGLVRLVVYLPRALLRLAGAWLRLVTLWVWVLLRCGVPYALLVCLGFAVMHGLWLLCRGQPMSMSVVLKTLNLTLPTRACPF